MMFENHRTFKTQFAGRELIVETGKTLIENDLKPFETIVPISARLISNKVSFKFKNAQITELAKKIAEYCAE